MSVSRWHISLNGDDIASKFRIFSEFFVELHILVCPKPYPLGCPIIQQKTALKIAAGESSSDQFKPKIRLNNGFLAVGDGGPTLTFLA